MTFATKADAIAQERSLLQERYPEALICVHCAKLVATQFRSHGLSDDARLKFACAECRRAEAPKAAPALPFVDDAVQPTLIDRLIQRATMEGRAWTTRKVLRVVAASETTGSPLCEHRRHLGVKAAKLPPCPHGCRALPPTTEPGWAYDPVPISDEAEAERRRVPADTPDRLFVRETLAMADRLLYERATPGRPKDAPNTPQNPSKLGGAEAEGQGPALPPVPEASVSATLRQMQVSEDAGAAVFGGARTGARGVYALAWRYGAIRGTCGTPALFGTLARLPGVTVVREESARLQFTVAPEAVRAVLDVVGARRPLQEARALEAARRHAEARATRRRSARTPVDAVHVAR